MTLAQGNSKFGHRATCILVVAAVIIAVGLVHAKHATAQDKTDETFILNLTNVDIHSLIETVSMRTGKNFIVDPRVEATVNVVSSEAISATKLYEMFLSVLEVNGFAAVQAGKFTKIVPTMVGVQNAVPLINEHIISGDKLASRVIHLESMPALQVIETLRPLLSESASLVAESSSNAIIITDHAANIEKLIELINVIDGR